MDLVDVMKMTSRLTNLVGSFKKQAIWLINLKLSLFVWHSIYGTQGLKNNIIWIFHVYKQVCSIRDE